LDFLEPDFSDKRVEDASDSTSSPASLAAANYSLFFFFSSCLTSFYASLTILSSYSLYKYAIKDRFVYLLFFFQQHLSLLFPYLRHLQ